MDLLQVESDSSTCCLLIFNLACPHSGPPVCCSGLGYSSDRLGLCHRESLSLLFFPICRSSGLSPWPLNIAWTTLHKLHAAKKYPQSNLKTMIRLPGPSNLRFVRSTASNGGDIRLSIKLAGLLCRSQAFLVPFSSPRLFNQYIIRSMSSYADVRFRSFSYSADGPKA